LQLVWVVKIKDKQIKRIVTIFGYIMSIASMITMTIILELLILNDYAVVTAPYGEAPFEISMLLFSCGVISFLCLKEIKGNKLKSIKEQRNVVSKANKLTVFFIVLTVLCIVASNMITAYSLENYPSYVYERNHVMRTIFEKYGYGIGLVYSLVGYIGTSLVLMFATNKLSKIQKYPFNLIIIMCLPMISIAAFGFFFYIAYSDYRIMQSIIALVH